MTMTSHPATNCCRSLQSNFLEGSAISVDKMETAGIAGCEGSYFEQLCELWVSKRSLKIKFV